MIMILIWLDSLLIRETLQNHELITRVSFQDFGRYVKVSSTMFFCAYGLKVSVDRPMSLVYLYPQNTKSDIVIRSETISSEEGTDDHTVSFPIDELGTFRISNGNSISFCPFPERKYDDALFSLTVFGICMGTILHQRGEFVLHGSCVTRGNKTILVTGVSGAGKSTLAAEFLKNGWEMVTDDIALIKGIEEGHPMVQSSYPSQKLWEDAIARNNIALDKQTVLYTEENRSKVNVHIDHFHEGLSPLTDIICLYPTEKECDIIPVTGLAIVDQLMRNTYRAYMIPESQRQQHFQRCITLSKQIRMHAVLRARDRDTAPELYEKIIQATED